MATDQKIPPKSEWLKLSVSELYNVRGDMMDLYYKMRGANASFAHQYQGFISEIDALIQKREGEKEEQD